MNRYYLHFGETDMYPGGYVSDYNKPAKYLLRSIDRKTIEYLSAQRHLQAIVAQFGPDIVIEEQSVFPLEEEDGDRLANFMSKHIAEYAKNGPVAAVELDESIYHLASQVVLPPGVVLLKSLWGKSMLDVRVFLCLMPS